MRPTSIKVQLYMNADKYGDPVELNEANNWSYTWYDLPPVKVVDGYMVGDMSISYVAMEVGDVSYYVGDPDWTSDPHKTTITNTYTPEKIEIEGSKTWDDNNNQVGKRPESIKINLYADGEYLDSRTVTEADKWKWTFDNLDVYANGTPIEYTITEDAVEGYTTQINGFNVTNTHTPEKTEISGSKTWDDNNNQDGIRPDSITIHLFANGSEVDSRTVTEKQNWSWTFDELPKKEKGVDIVYTITEDPVEGYTTIVNGPDVTNTHVPATVSLTVKKSWNDNENQDGKRPDYIDVQLLANGTEYGDPERLSEANGWEYTWESLPKFSGGIAIKYSVKELPQIEGYVKTSAITYKDDGKTINVALTNTHNPEKTVVSGSKTWEDNNNQDGKRPESITINLLANGVKLDSKTVTAADNWSWTFDELDVYANGNKITYTITEDEVADYASQVIGYNVTNTHTPEIITISGTKTWEDNNDQDGKRPESITINLLADGTKKTSKTVTPNSDGKWEYTFDNLPKNRNGKAIVYTIEEIKVEGYESKVEGYNVINTHTPETITISGTKTWEDNNDQDGKRPTSITINLLADGTKKTSKTVTPNSEGKWEYTFENLPKNRNGKAIVYTIEEVPVEGYVSDVHGYDVTNTHTSETITISGTKTWEDNNNQDGKRPESITINLFADGTKKASKVVTPNAEGKWEYTFENLPKYENGTEIKYTIEEVPVEGYVSDVHGYDVTNTHTPETITISGTKTWEDNNNQDGVRPTSITINLLADGTKKASKTITPNAEGKWEYTFENLPKNRNGKAIVYTIEEIKVEGYESKVDGYNVINTHIPETTELTVVKLWDDGNDFDSIRPSSITVRLLADGSEYGDKMVLNAHNNWTAKWENLPKYDNGTEIKYTVEEEPVLGYSASYSGIIGNTITITNTHAPQKYDNYISISGHKIWDDSNDILGIRPDSITVYLLADGVVRRTAMVTAANGWQWHFNDLDKYHNGVPVVYTVYEEPVEGYISRVDGYNIINYYIPEPLEPDIPVEAEQGSDSVDHSASSDSGVMAAAISALLGTALAIGLAKILARKVNS